MSLEALPRHSRAVVAPDPELLSQIPRVFPTFLSGQNGQNGPTLSPPNFQVLGHRPLSCCRGEEYCRRVAMLVCGMLSGKVGANEWLLTIGNLSYVSGRVDN